MRFGQKLKLFRRRRGLTQKELAKMLKTSQSAIHFYETGQRTPNASTVANFIQNLELNKYEVAEFLADFELAKENVPIFESAEYELEEAIELAREFDDEHKRFIASVIKETYKKQIGELPPK